MSVTADDLKYYRSDEGDSEGGGISAVEIVNGDTDLWPNITDPERVAGGERIRKWFLANEHSTDDLLQPSVYVFVTPTYTVEELGLGWNDVDDDDSGQGNMTAFTANAVLAAVSNGSDTRTLDIVGLNGSGVRTTEQITLNGTTEVLSTTTWSVVYGCHLSAVNASRIVTVKQGTGGTTRGTLGVNTIACWLWVEATSIGTGIRLDDLAAGGEYGFWDRLTWEADSGSISPNRSAIAVEEDT